MTSRTGKIHVIAKDMHVIREKEMAPFWACCNTEVDREGEGDVPSKKPSPISLSLPPDAIVDDVIWGVGCNGSGAAS